MKIVAIDFETANKYAHSACSLGYAVYEDGVITKSGSFLILPPKDVRYFTFSFIHHLSLEDVRDQEEFDKHYEFLSELFEGAYLCAHNARFDIGVLNAMCDRYHLKHFKNYYFDTVSLSRQIFDLPNHKLNTVCQALEVSLNHHEAGSDAYGCLMIVLKAMEVLGEYDIDKVLKKTAVYLAHNK